MTGIKILLPIYCPGKQGDLRSNYMILLVEVEGYEPSTLALRTRCSPTELHPHKVLSVY